MIGHLWWHDRPSHNVSTTAVRGKTWQRKSGPPPGAPARPSRTPPTPTPQHKHTRYKNTANPRGCSIGRVPIAFRAALNVPGTVPVTCLAARSTIFSVPDISRPAGSIFGRMPTTFRTARNATFPVPTVFRPARNATFPVPSLFLPADHAPGSKKIVYPAARIATSPTPNPRRAGGDIIGGEKLPLRAGGDGIGGTRCRTPAGLTEKSD